MANKGVKTIVYSNDFDKEKFDQCKEVLVENENRFPTDNQVFDEMNFANEIEYEDFRSDFDNWIDGKTCILSGSVERWNDVSFGASVVKSYKEISHYFIDCDYITISDIDGHLNIWGAHHDGEINMELRVLSKAGIRYLENYENSGYEDKRSPQYVYNKLASNKYSNNANYCCDVWGK